MSEKFTVLVLEDDEIAYKLIETALYFLNVQVIHAETGKEGIELFKENKADMVLLDLNLPDMDGFEIVKTFTGINANIPIVAQTAYAISNEKHKCLELGCVDFFLKPLNIKKIKTIINRYRK
jgi:CheY-like chemotaxis protein